VVVPSVKPSANIHKGRELTPIPPYFPLNISSGHEKFLSVVAVCLLYDFKILSSTTAAPEQGFAVCDLNRGTATCVNWPEN
jgi:hypothetical protein